MQLLSHEPAMLPYLSHLGDHLVLCGELVGGKEVAFDRLAIEVK